MMHALSNRNNQPSMLGRPLRAVVASFALLVNPVILSACAKDKQEEAGKRAVDLIDSSNPQERMNAVAAMHDSVGLQSWAMGSRHADVRQACVEKLLHFSDFHELVRVFHGTEHGDTQQLITARFTAMVDRLNPERASEREVLVHIASHSTDQRARSKAVQKLRGYVEELTEVAAWTSDPNTAKEALQLLPSYQNVVNEQQERLGALREALRKVANSSTHRDVRIGAVWKMQGDRKGLAHVLEWSNDPNIKRLAEDAMR